VRKKGRKREIGKGAIVKDNWKEREKDTERGKGTIKKDRERKKWRKR
jgi:hypothetical protein